MRRKEETERRAAEAARKAREEKERADKEAADERAMRKELRTGGGFDLKKHNAMLAAKAAAEQ